MKYLILFIPLILLGAGCTEEPCPENDTACYEYRLERKKLYTSQECFKGDNICLAIKVCENRGGVPILDSEHKDDYVSCDFPPGN